VKKSLSIMPVTDVDEVIRLSLVRMPEPVEWVDVDAQAAARSGSEAAADTGTALPN
jgi:hypothetical protein